MATHPKPRFPATLEPVTLRGRLLTLEPLSAGDAPAWFAAADESCFRYHAQAPDEWSVAGFARLVGRALDDKTRVPFAVRLNATGEIIGSSSYMEIRPAHRGLEIGYTWLASNHRATGVNPEKKLLMIRHAFERLGAMRVQLKCDARNIQSQRAIEKLGAVKEGVLRRHVVMPDGFIRDTVVYSIVDSEWPRVKAGLIARLGYEP